MNGRVLIFFFTSPPPYVKTTPQCRNEFLWCMKFILYHHSVLLLPAVFAPMITPVLSHNSVVFCLWSPSVITSPESNGVSLQTHLCKSCRFCHCALNASEWTVWCSFMFHRWFNNKFLWIMWELRLLSRLWLGFFKYGFIYKPHLLHTLLSNKIKMKDDLKTDKNN